MGGCPVLSPQFPLSRQDLVIGEQDVFRAGTAVELHLVSIDRDIWNHELIFARPDDNLSSVKCVIGRLCEREWSWSARVLALSVELHQEWPKDLFVSVASSASNL